jgi:hypothetical protein
MFYVYAHYRNDTNALFYIGKGKNKRWRSTANRNRHWQRVVTKANGFMPKIIITDADEEFAYFAEKEAINVYLRRGAKLVNMTDGGDGMYGVCDEIRQRTIESNKRRAGEKRKKATFTGKKHTEEYKAYMKEKMTNRQFSEETRQKMSAAQKARFASKPESEETKRKRSEAQKLRYAKNKVI